MMSYKIRVIYNVHCAILLDEVRMPSDEVTAWALTFYWSPTLHVLFDPFTLKNERVEVVNSASLINA